MHQNPTSLKKRIFLKNYRFEPNKIGENIVTKALPSLCEVLGLQRYTNNSLRPTAIRQLKRSGAEDREVMNITGHKSVKTLSNYHLAPSIDRKRKLAEAISTGNRKSADLAEENELAPDPLPQASRLPLADLLCEPFAKPLPQSAPKNKILPKQPKPSTSNASNDTFSLDFNDSFDESLLVLEDDLNVIEMPENVEIVVKETKKQKLSLKNNDDKENSCLTQGNNSNLNKNANPFILLLKREQDLAAQQDAKRHENDQIRLKLLEKAMDSMK